MMQIVTEINNVDFKQWGDFVKNHPKGNIFQTPEFNLSLKKSKYYDSIIISAFDTLNHKLSGLLTGVIQKEYKGILGFFTSRCIIIGEPLALNNSFQIQKELLDNFEKKFNRKVIFTQFRFTNPIDKELRIYLENNKYSYEPYLNIIIDTGIGIDNLWKEIKRNRKDGINKGKKQEFEFSTGGKDVDVFYLLLKSTYLKAKKPFPKIEYFNALIENYNPEIIRFFVLKYKNEVIISLLAFCYKNILYAYYIGINQDPKLLNLRPVDYFYWEVIKWCSDNDIKYFDWMGAGNKNESYGVRDFKLQYGGFEFEPGRMSKFNNVFIKIFFNKLLYIWRLTIK